MAKKPAKTAVDINHDDVVLAPHSTEKSTLLSEHNEGVFKVAGDATKPQIKAAAEALFSVKVTGVNTLTQKGYAKRWKGRTYTRSERKQEHVTLATVQFIDGTIGTRGHDTWANRTHNTHKQARQGL